MDAAADGSLERPDVLASHVDRLLETSAGQETVWHHIRDWFLIDNILHVAPDEETFGRLPPELGNYLLADVEHRFRQTALAPEGDFMEVYSTRDVLVNETLAGIYGISGVSGDDLIPYRFSTDSPYAGILTSPGFSALMSTNVETSAVKRGKYIRQRILCGVIRPPPPAVDDEIQPASQDAITQRQRLAQHSEEGSSCYSCHRSMDPLGFPLVSDARAPSTADG